MIPRHHMNIDTAIEQIGGLVDILHYIHANASDADRRQMREAEGWLLLTMADCVERARGDVTTLFHEHKLHVIEGGRS